MKSFRTTKYIERYEDVVFDLETALNKFPFCGDFSLHLHKMVRVARNFTQAVNFQRFIETR